MAKVIKVKKTFQPIYVLLVENESAKVSDIMPELLAIMQPKSGAKKSTGPRQSKTVIRDADGKPVAIKCYYFKRWMPLVGDDAVEFGVKASSATGYNSMCKEGLSHWNKQNTEAKKALENILVEVEAGDLETSDIADRKAEIQAARDEVADTTLGFTDAEDITAYLVSEGVELAETEE